MQRRTSAAAPHVSAVAILLTTRWPNDHPVSIRNRIWRSADEDLQGDDYIGFFRLNAHDALEGIFKR